MSTIAPAEKSCARCGVPLPGDAPSGICPRCELQAVLALLPAGEAEARGGADQSASDTTPFAQRRFGNYELLEEIARGGMGIVYRARQVNLDRVVAVKMILGGQFAGKQFVQRFRAEAGAAAVLQHPNIVAVHDVGVEDGQHYFSMDFVEGASLAQLVGQRPLAPAKAVRYVKLIAEAIHYAHEQGILHRDLKPSNVLIDANDQPRITDFGLAKRLDGESSLTMTGQLLGSPNFMPPEQTSANRGKVGRSSDVYGLGAVLYFLVTARAPFQADSLEALVTQVVKTDPISPRLLNPAVPRDLETICLKCLAKEPVKRYSTAQMLAEELGRFLRNEPIVARPVNSTEKVLRWCRRNPNMAALTASLVLMFILGFFGVLWQLRRAERGERTAEWNLYVADMNLAMQAWNNGNIERARTLLLKHSRTEPALRGFEWRLLQELCREGDAFHNFSGHRDSVSSVVFCPDGERLFSAGRDGTVRVWATKTGQSRVLAASPVPISLALSPDGLILATGGEDRIVRLWDVASGRTLQSLSGHTSFIYALAFSADGQRLASGSADETIRLWEVKTGQPLGLPLEHEKIVTDLTFSPLHENLLAACGPARSVSLWDVNARTNRPITRHTSGVQVAAFSPDGDILAAAGWAGVVELWDMNSNESLGSVGQGAPIGCLSFSPDGEHLATAGTDQIIHLWSVRSRQQVRAFRGHTGAIGTLAFSTDGHWLASGSADGTVRLWEVIPASGPRNVLEHAGEVNALSFSADGKLLAAADVESWKLHLWDANTGRELASLPVEPKSVWSLAFSKTDIITIGGRNGVLQRWNPTERQIVVVTQAHVGAIESVGFSRDGRLMATASRDPAEPTVKLWDAHALTVIDALPGRPEIARAVAFSPVQPCLAVGGRDREVRLWSYEEGRVLSLTGHQAEIWCLGFSPDGRLLASGDAARRILLWDMERRQWVASLEGHDAPVNTLAFSPDGRTLASGSEDSTVRLWNLALRQEVAMLRGHASQVNQLTFSPDGTILATASSDGTVKLWRARPD